MAFSCLHMSEGEGTSHPVCSWMRSSLLSFHNKRQKIGVRWLSHRKSIDCDTMMVNRAGRRDAAGKLVISKQGLKQVLVSHTHKACTARHGKWSTSNTFRQLLLIFLCQIHVGKTVQEA